LNVLFLSTWFPYPPDNGARIRAHYLLRALAAKHDVTVVAFRPEGGQPPEQIARSYGDRVQVHAVPVSPFRYVTLPPAVRFASPLPLAFVPCRTMRAAVARIVAGRRWDATVAIQTPVAQYALQAGQIPRVLDVDTAFSYQMRERFEVQGHSAAARIHYWIGWQKVHRYETRMFRKFGVCTVAGAHEMPYVSNLVKPGPTAVTLIPNGVDCQHNRTGLAPTEPARLVFNGALTYGANFDAMRFFLAEVYPAIRAQSRDVSLTITGRTDGVPLADLRLDDSVRLSGYVDDIRPVIAGAEVCVVPLRQGGGTRLKILEAMALGTPVVATAKGAEGLDVTPGRDILIADEPADLAACVVRLLGDAELRQRLAGNARRLVAEHHDWQQIGQRFVELVERAAGGQPACEAPS
jgi:glycosyltransferase involved in cell wall biosynthesis